MERSKRLLIVGLVLALALTTALISGCGKKSSGTPKSGPTAIGGLATAESTMSTTAPDAKLLVVQTAQPVEATATPVWAYVFGSPSTGKTYVSYLLNGQPMGTQEAGEAGLSESDWSKVPGTDEWTIDSDEAYSKALAVSGATGKPKAYLMGLMTFKSSTDTSTVQPFVWQVIFDPGESGATSSTITVDAKTGVAAISK